MAGRGGREGGGDRGRAHDWECCLVPSICNQYSGKEGGVAWNMDIGLQGKAVATYHFPFLKHRPERSNSRP